MIENLLHLRVVENKDWATILFIISFTSIALTKSMFENRFADFAKLIYSNKYANIYKDGSHLRSGFTISLLFVQILSLAFFIQLSAASFGYASKTDWILYIQIITSLVFFILSKFLIEKIIATAFDIEEFVEQFNLHKVIFRTYIGLYLLPINVVLFYNDTISSTFLIVIIAILLGINLLTYSVLIKTHQKPIFSKLLYYILYLCTLEIAPYYLIYYWLTKNIY